jgi:3-dehydroquinate synthase
VSATGDARDASGAVRTVGVEAGGEHYEVHIGVGLLERLGELYGRPTGVALVVCDENIAPLYLERVVEGLAAAGLRPSSIVLPPGEQTKSCGSLMRLYERLYELGAGRDDTVVALGGGVIGDLAGYAAATFLRGLRLVQAPTTILAMVDAAVGGKVAVDFRQGKNYLGTFYQPALVVEDVLTLATLPEREVRGGWAEVIKHGLLDGGATLTLTEDNVARGARLEPRLLEADVRVKAAIVCRDPRETTGARAALNLGHTIGHAIEVAGGYTRYSHGEAVALGLRAALWLSERLQGLGPAAATRGQELLSAAGLPERLTGIAAGDVARLLERDKKAVDGTPRFVLLAGLGEPVTGAVVPSTLQHEVIAWLIER